MAEPSPSPLASNNPFRRPAPPSAAPESDAAPSESRRALDGTAGSFRDQLRSLPRSSEAPPSTTFQKPKPVKKVRVQSPPPSSPESAHDADFNARFPAARPPDESSDDDADDPFQTEVAAPADAVDDESPDEAVASRRRPPNPFQKTLRDLESPARDGAPAATAGAPAAKGSLDVNSFGRLLLTGQAGASAGAGGPSSPAPAPAPTPADAGSLTDTSSVSRQSIFDAAHAPQETPRTSHELSDSDDSDEESGLIHTPQQPSALQRTTLRKKPPPPSSRHGKLIKIQLKSDGAAEDGPAPKPPPAAGGGSVYSPSASRSGRPSSSSSDVNKPLPPPPRRSLDEDPESVFDREAAGKIPEVDIDPDAPDEAIPPPRPPTPPNASHATPHAQAHNPLAPSSTTPARKPAAPPPRRQAHGRSESRAAADAGSADDPPLRSSFESARSVSSSVKLSIHAPAPPAPRRPAHASRPSTGSFASPSAPSFSSAPSPPLSSDTDRGLAWASSPAGSVADAPSTAGATRSAKDATSVGPPGQQSKLSPPPPPPARHTSVRGGGRERGLSEASSTSTARPPSRSGTEAPPAGPVRRISRESMAPPPPPPRQRGSSRGSTDGVGLGARKMSADSVRTLGHAAPVGGEAGITVVTEEPAEAEEDASAADGILADLDALQREVDALRGRFDRGPAGGS